MKILTREEARRGKIVLKYKCSTVKEKDKEHKKTRCELEIITLADLLMET